MCSGLESVVIPSGIEKVRDRTFFMCSNLRTVELPSKLSELESGAFGDCKKLKTIAIPEGTKTIMPSAFYNCYLEKIAIPFSVIRIGRQGINGAVYGNKTEQAYYWQRYYDYTLGYSELVIYCDAGSLAMEFARWNKQKCLRYEDYWK